MLVFSNLEIYALIRASCCQTRSRCQCRYIPGQSNLLTLFHSIFVSSLVREGDMAVTVGFICVDRGDVTATPGLGLANTSPHPEALSNSSIVTVPNSHFFSPGGNTIDPSKIMPGDDIFIKCISAEDAPPPLSEGLEKRQVLHYKQHEGTLTIARYSGKSLHAWIILTQWNFHLNLFSPTLRLMRKRCD